jgi:hypothetical protein
MRVVKTRAIIKDLGHLKANKTLTQVCLFPIIVIVLCQNTVVMQPNNLIVYYHIAAVFTQYWYAGVNSYLGKEKYQE